MLRDWTKTMALLGAALILGGAGVADAKVAENKSLGEVVVTAERFPTQEKTSPRFVTITTGETLMETGGANLVEALRRTGGFTYKSFGPLGTSFGGMNSEVMVRGISKGVLVLINGSPVQGAAGGGYDLNMIPVEHVDRVEVMKGAASTLYGADAMSGVINIITKKNTETPSRSFAVEAGSHGHRKVSASAMGSRVNVGVVYSHLDEVTRLSEKIYPTKPSKNYTYHRDAVDNVAMNLTGTLADGLFVDYVGAFSKTGYKKISASGALSKGTDQDHAKHFLDLRYERESMKLKAFGYYDLLEREEYTETPVEKDENKNYNYGVQGDYRFSLAGFEMTTGADFVLRGADYNNKYGRHERNDTSFFLQAKKEVSNALTMVVGFREQLINGDCKNRDYDIFLPSAGVNYKVSEPFHLFANAGKAFRAPTFNDLYYKGDVLTGNPDLKPESGWTYEVGGKLDTDFMKVRLAAFFMTYDDKIETSGSGSTATKINAGEYESKGAEWETSFYPFAESPSFLEAISFDVSGSWADAEARDKDGEWYQSAPKFQTSVGISYLTDPVVLNLNCDIVRKRERELPSYNPVNFNGRVAFWKGFLTFGVDNMFDETVVTNGNMTEGLSSHYAYYDLGRTFKGGYELRF